MEITFFSLHLLLEKGDWPKMQILFELVTTESAEISLFFCVFWSQHKHAFYSAFVCVYVCVCVCVCVCARARVCV